MNDLMSTQDSQGRYPSDPAYDQSTAPFGPKMINSPPTDPRVGNDGFSIPGMQQTGATSDVQPTPSTNPIKEILGPSIWDQIGAHDAYVADSIAKQKMRRGIAEGVVNTAMQTGQTVDQQDDARMQSQIAPIAGQLAQATAGMPDDQFQALVSHVSNALTGQFHPNNTLGPDSAIPAASPTILDQVTPPQGVGPTSVTPPAGAPESQPNTQTGLDSSDDQFKSALSDFQKTIATAPPIPQREELKGPTWAQAGLTALAALSAPRFAGDTAAAMFNSLSTEHDKHWNEQLQAYQMKDQAWQHSVAGKQFLVGTLAAYQNHQLQREYQRLQLTQRLDEKTRTNASQLLGRYLSANTGPEKEAAAAAYNAAPGVKGTALEISPQTLNADKNQLHLAGVKIASDEWEKSLTHELNEFGEVPEARAKILEGQRIALAGAYGIDPGTLRPVPTASTLRKQAVDTRTQQLKDNKAFRDQKRLDDFVSLLADRDMAERRLSETTRHDQAMEKLGIVNYGLSNYNAQLKAAEFNAKNNGVQDAIDKALNNPTTGLERVRIPAQQGIVDGIPKDPNDPTKAKDPKRQKELDSAMDKMNGLKASAASLKAAASPNITFQNPLGGATIDTGVPSPNYVAPNRSVAPTVPVNPFAVGEISHDPSVASKGAKVNGGHWESLKGGGKVWVDK